MRRQQAGHVRIAIAGNYLDEVQIRHARRDAPGSLSYLSFPAYRHWAQVEEGHLLVSAQAPTVVQLFADRVLAPIGGPPVTVTIDDQELGPCLLEAVEADGTSPFDNSIVLRFRRQAAGRP